MAESVEATTDVGNTAYINATYRGLIGRLPTPSEFTAASTLIDDRGRNAFAATLAASDAWLGHFVDDLYEQAFSRVPDASGRTYWIGQLRDGASTVDVAASVLGSEEFRQQEGGTDRGVAEGLYRRVLSRDADPEGLDYWEGQIGSEGIAGVSRGFFQSEENRLRRVGLLYDGLLCRPGDAEGAAYWADQMAGTSDHVLSLFIVGSAEFANNAETEQCKGNSDNDPALTTLTTLAMWDSVAFFDTAAGEIIVNVDNDQDPYVAIVSAEDGQPVRRWGADGTITSVTDVSRDGRFVLLLTGDPALTGGLVIEHPYESRVLVMVDRTDDSFALINVPLDRVDLAQISDDGSILWLTGMQNFGSEDVLGVEHFRNAYRYDRSTQQIERVTNSQQNFGSVFGLDASADGNTIILTGSLPFGPLEGDESLDAALWMYDADTGEHLRVPYDSFKRHGPAGKLDASGDRVLAFDTSFQGRSIVVYDRGDVGVELLGTAQDSATGDVTDDGTVLVWTKASTLNESFRVVSTTIGIRRPGQEDQTLEVEAEVVSLELSQDGSKLLIQTSPLVFDDTTTLIIATLN